MTRYNVVRSTQTSSPLWRPYTPSGKPLPPAVNNRSLYGPILNQEALGACMSFSSNQWRIALYVMGGGKWQRLSELAAYYEERVINKTVSTDSGATVAEAVQVLEQFGGMPESDDSFDPDYGQNFTDAPPNDWDPTLKLSPTQVLYIGNGNVANTKDAVAQGMPVVFGFECFAELESQQVALDGILPMPSQPNNSIGGHAVNIIGYDDSVQSFLCLNQWGEAWGIKAPASLQGCFWMPYAYFAQYGFDACAGLPDNGVQPKPQPAPTNDYTFDVAFSPTQTTQGATANLIVTTAQGLHPVANATITRSLTFTESGSNFSTNATFTTGTNGLYGAGLGPNGCTQIVADCSWTDPSGRTHTGTATTTFAPMPKPIPAGQNTTIDVAASQFQNVPCGTNITVSGTFTEDGKPLVGYPLTFKFSTGETQQATTDTSGKASVQWTTHRPGFVFVTASYGDLEATTETTWVAATPQPAPTPTPSPKPQPNPQPTPSPKTVTVQSMTAIYTDAQGNEYIVKH